MGEGRFLVPQADGCAEAGTKTNVDQRKGVGLTALYTTNARGPPGPLLGRGNLEGAIPSIIRAISTPAFLRLQQSKKKQAQAPGSVPLSGRF